MEVVFNETYNYQNATTIVLLFNSFYFSEATSHNKNQSFQNKVDPRNINLGVNCDSNEKLSFSFNITYELITSSRYIDRQV